MLQLQRSLRVLITFLLCSFALFRVAVSDAEVLSPKQYHKKAMSLAKSGALLESLQYFRAASRAMPKHVEYLNNLGVTEMRLGEVEKAMFRFKQILGMDGEYAKAIKNMEEVRNVHWLFTNNSVLPFKLGPY